VTGISVTGPLPYTSQRLPGNGFPINHSSTSSLPSFPVEKSPDSISAHSVRGIIRFGDLLEPLVPMHSASFGKGRQGISRMLGMPARFVF